MKKFILSLFFFYLFFFIGEQPNSTFAQSYFPKSDLIEQVLQDLKKNYVDVERLEPYKMLQAALENLARRIPPIVLKEFSGDPFNSFVLQVDKTTRKFNIPKLEKLKDLSNSLQIILIHIKQNLPKETDLKNIDYVAVNGFLSVLDPHTNLLVPEVYTEFREDTGGNYSGVGMYIGVRDEKLQVISPIFNSPAYKSGLQAKDNILQINGESTINMNTSSASSKIKGPVGTKVKLLISRKEFAEPKIFEITRARIDLKSAKGLELKTKTGRIGYISISRFHQKTGKEVEDVLDNFQTNLSDFQGIILDLRNNPGGILQQAVKVSDKFLAKGKIVTTAGIADKPKLIYNAKKINSITDIPIVVLLNGGSASASEILAAALKQNNRALVIGTQSFGKGSVQQLRKYRDGSALKLTTSKYLTPNNNSLHSIGIVPHIEVKPWIINDNNISIISAKKLFPDKKDKFAEWGATNPENPVYSFNYLFDKNFEHQVFSTSEKKENTAGFDIENIKKNYLLYFSSKILQTSQEKKFNQFLESAVNTARTEEQVQNVKLQNQLEKIGISWKKKKQIDQDFQINFWVEKKKEAKQSCLQNKIAEIQASDEVTLCLELENSSQQETIRLLALGTSPHFIFDKKQFVFGNIPGKKSKKWFVSAKIPNNFSASEIPFTIQVLNGEEQEIASKKVFFFVKEIPQPRIHYTIQSYSEQGAITAGNSVKLIVEASNQAEVDSGELKISLKNGEGGKVFLTAGKASTKNLSKGEKENFTFGFDLKAPIPDGKIDLSLSLSNSKYRQNISHNFTIPYGIKEKFTITNSAPTIEIKKYPLQVETEKISLQISSQDDQKVKDIYIFNNNNKEFYQSFSAQKVMQKIPIKLTDGFNKVVVFSRDNYNITSSKSIFIYKH